MLPAEAETETKCDSLELKCIEDPLGSLGASQTISLSHRKKTGREGTKEKEKGSREKGEEKERGRGCKWIYFRQGGDRRP